MRIQMDILRDILKVVIDDESQNLTSFDFTGDGISYETIAFHIKILIDEGCLTALDRGTKDSPAYYCIQQTFKGQQFYDAIEDDNTWQKIKKFIWEHGMEITTQAIAAAAGQILSGKVPLQ